MDTEDRRLDGNAAAGVLREIFSFDISNVKARCAGCGATEPTGADLVYADAPGVVVRCVHCSNVLMTVVHDESRYWFEMKGVSVLQIASA